MTISSARPQPRSLRRGAHRLFAARTPRLLRATAAMLACVTCMVLVFGVAMGETLCPPSGQSGPVSGASSGPVSGATSGPVSSPISSSISRAVSGALSGSMSGPASCTCPGTSGPVSGSTSGPVSGPTSGSVSGPVSAPASGPVSGPAGCSLSGPVSGGVSAPISPPVSAPGAVGAVTTDPGDRTVALTWAPPSTGGAVDTYTVVTFQGATRVLPDVTVDGGTRAATVGGLTNGLSYTFQVDSRNGAGSASSAPTAPVTPRTVPGIPTGVSATAGDASATVAWTAPATDGGSAITGYEVAAYQGAALVGTVTTPDGSTLTAPVSGLANGAAHTFQVQAINAAGKGPASDPTTPVTPRGVPGAPADVSVTAGNGSLAVAWAAPADDGGSPITRYAVAVHQGATLVKNVSTADGSTLRSSVSGLTNGVAYTVDVRAINAVGEGQASARTAPVTPRTVPGAPTNVAATGGNSSVTVTWAAPASDGGSAVTGYRVDAYQGTTLVKTVTTPDGSTLTALVDGLTNGTAYTFRVRAHNEAGVGASSASTPAVTPRTTAGAPTNVSATAGNGSASVTWAAPAANGGSPVTSYKVAVHQGTTLVKSISTVDGSTLRASVSGLTNGVAYTFDVRAINAVGEGPASAPTAPVTPRTVPGAPTNVTATGGNSSVTVNWAAPTSDGGAAVTSYRIYAYQNGTLLKSVAVAGGASRSGTVTGLTNGTAYTFRVRAYNAAGVGAYSTSTPAVLAGTTAGAPTNVSATAGNGSVSVAWTAPADNGGSPVTSYKVAVYQGATLVKHVSTADGSTFRSSVTGLTNGLAYTFEVRAVNAIGEGTPSAPTAPVTPRTVPGAPRNVTATAGNSSVTVNWAAPTSDGGSPVTSYRIYVYRSGTLLKSVAISGGASRSGTVTGLTNGTAYTFRVRAYNAAGVGAFSAYTPAVTPVA